MVKPILRPGIGLTKNIWFPCGLGIAIHTSVFIVTGKICQTLICMFVEFRKMEQFTQGQR